jgi:hypothetical protein
MASLLLGVNVATLVAPSKVTMPSTLPDFASVKLDASTLVANRLSLEVAVMALVYATKVGDAAGGAVSIETAAVSALAAAT